MHKRFLPFTIVFLICISVASIAFAEKQEWFDKAYDFSKVKRVLIYPPNISNKLKNGIVENEILEIFNTKTKLPEQVKVITFFSLIDAVKTDTGTDLVQLHAKNSQEALKLLNEATPKYADIVVTSTVFEYSMGSEYREGFTYNTTEYQTSYVHGAGGSATVQTPVNRTHTVRGGNVPVAYSSVRWDVYDAQTGKAVFSRLEDRARANPTVFDHTKPKSLYGRITASFFDDLSEKLDKDK
jgi:hypothetical protein